MTIEIIGGTMADILLEDRHDLSGFFLLHSNGTSWDVAS